MSRLFTWPLPLWENENLTMQAHYPEGEGHMIRLCSQSPLWRGLHVCQKYMRGVISCSQRGKGGYIIKHSGEYKLEYAGTIECILTLGFI